MDTTTITTPWAAVASLVERLHGVTPALSALADEAPVLLRATQDESAWVAPGVAASEAARFADAATAARQAAERLQIAAVISAIATDAHHLDHARTTRAWLAHHHGVSPGTAAVWCRAAETCGRYPAAAAAFFAGTITVAHLDAWAHIIPTRFRGPDLDQAVERVRDISDELATVAAEHDPATFADLCGRVRDRLDEDGPGDPTTAPSRISLHRGHGGRWLLTGDLAPDDGAQLATLLDDLANQRRRARRDVDVADHQSGDTGDGSAASPLDPGEQRARDLLDAVRAGVVAGRPGRVGLYLHVDLDHLRRTAHGRTITPADVLAGDRPAHTESDLDITDPTLWGLLADADVTPVFRRSGHTVSFGRTRRLAPPILKRIIAHRDRRCPIPGCDRPPIFNDAHHITHWDDLGPTDLDNLLGPCAYHHHRHHAGHYRISGNPETDEGIRITQPDGTPVERTARWRRLT